MKPTRVENTGVHAVVTNDIVYLVITDSWGRTITFEPPASVVTQRWAQEMRDKALKGEQLELKL